MEREWERQLQQRREREREEKEALEFVAADRHSRRDAQRSHSTARLPLALTASSLLPSALAQSLTLLPPPVYHAHGLLPSKEHAWKRHEEEKSGGGGTLPELVGVKAQRVARREEEKEQTVRGAAVDCASVGEDVDVVPVALPALI